MFNPVGKAFQRKTQGLIDRVGRALNFQYDEQMEEQRTANEVRGQSIVEQRRDAAKKPRKAAAQTGEFPPPEAPAS